MSQSKVNGDLQKIVDAISEGYSMTISDAKKKSNYQAMHLRKLCRTDKLDARKIGGRWLIKPASIDQYLSRPDVDDLKAKVRQLEKEIERLTQLTKES